jgi:hypothetical protein
LRCPFETISGRPPAPRAFASGSRRIFPFSEGRVLRELLVVRLARGDPQRSVGPELDPAAVVRVAGLQAADDLPLEDEPAAVQPVAEHLVLVGRRRAVEIDEAGPPEVGVEGDAEEAALLAAARVHLERGHDSPRAEPAREEHNAPRPLGDQRSRVRQEDQLPRRLEPGRHDRRAGLSRRRRARARNQGCCEKRCRKRVPGHDGRQC